MPYEDRHSQQKPCWYLEASLEPRQMNTQNQAIGHGSFFKRRAYDYTNNELNLPHGHKDRLRTVDLLPADRQCCEQDDDNSVLPSDWLECTGELHPALDRSFGPGTWKSLCMGDHKTQYGCFYNGITQHFQMV